jgi:hypothetical protein
LQAGGCHLDERIIVMIKISEQESKLIRKYFPYVHIRRTTHKYYMEENKKAMDFLKNYYKSKE